MSYPVYLLGRSREINLNRVLSLASVIAAQTSWPQDAPQILYADYDKSEPMDYNAVIKHFRDVVIPNEAQAVEKVRFNDDTFTRGQLMEKIAHVIGTDVVMPKGTVVSGDHRTLALLICEAVGKGVRYKVPFVKAKDPEVAGLASNVRHALSQGLSDAEIIPQVNALILSGKVNSANDLTALGFKHGKAQYIYNKAELVRLHGVSIDDAIRIPDRESAKAKNADNPRQYVADLLDGKGEAAPKAMSGKEIDDLIKLADSKGHFDKAGVLRAIRNGKRGAIEHWVLTGAIPADMVPPPAKDETSETAEENVAAVA